MKKRFFIVPFVIALIIIFIASFESIIEFITDYQWFRELNLTDTYLKRLKTQFTIGIPTFVLLSVFIYFYFIFIKKRHYRISGIDGSTINDRWLNRGFMAVSLFISFIISEVFISNLWFNILQFINRTSFNIKDPIFNNDISFYVFVLPLLKSAVGLLFFLIAMLLMLTFIAYLLLFSFRRGDSHVVDDDLFGSRRIPRFVNNMALKNAIFQLGILGSAIFVVLGLNFWLNTYELLYSQRGVVFGAGYTDVNITLWVYRAMAAASLVYAFIFLISIRRKSFRKAVIGVAVLFAISIIGNMAAGLVQRFIVEPDEISKEEKYIKYHIEHTQRAYGLDNVEEREFPVSQDLTREDLFENMDIVNNIRINDYLPIAQTYNQLQAIRLYYTFNDVDIDRYMVNGKYTQVFLSARELDQQNLQAATWINKHLKYTHGYGIVLSPVNAVTASGQPDLLIKNIPPVSDSDLEIKRPEIYFGESTNDYIIVNTDEMEFDYPEGSDNKHTVYEGTAGIELRGINRLLYAIRERNYKILVSSNINSDSRIVMYRNIMDRVNKIAPFMEYDEDPYIVLNQDDGRLYWIIDAYTVTDKYPYSKPFSKETDINYIRNSVKVVIDAYNGTTSFYVFDDNDPIVQTYRRIFPDLFADASEMPSGLLSHIRYPQTLFDIQSEVYRIYHIDNPMVFYNEEDFWDIAQEKYMSDVLQVESNYVMFKLPDEEDVEFLLTVPYTPRTKPNMTSLFVARNDGEDYGKLFLYKFPKGITVDGPMMVESRIDQNTAISEELTLWSQQGSRVLRGNMVIVPIENSLLYVEPIYLESDSENSLPEMKRVVVSFKDKIVMKESLREALENIFGIIEEVEEIPPSEEIHEGLEGDIEELVIRANELYNSAEEALRNGNWADYGKYMDELEKVLIQMESIFK
ncbi:MAG TPA: UPF0182 family protein [Tissierellia bacterium]|nr:UPF0182 family protein [Tissierellia bacterium]